MQDHRKEDFKQSYVLNSIISGLKPDFSQSITAVTFLIQLSRTGFTSLSTSMLVRIFESLCRCIYVTHNFLINKIKNPFHDSYTNSVLLFFRQLSLFCKSLL